MRVALYARVSTTRQAQAQTIEQQLTRLRSLVEQQGWTLSDQHIYRDDGFSGASLRNCLKSIRTPSGESSSGSLRYRSSLRYWREVLHSPCPVAGTESTRQTSARRPSAA